MARPKNDGRGRLGGRQKGTPNKDNPLKGYIRAHSLEYFEPKEHQDPETGHITITSRFDLDLLLLTPDDRVNAELRLLEYTMPKMKSVDVEMNVNTERTIEDTLARLCGEDQDHPYTP